MAPSVPSSTTMVSRNNKNVEPFPLAHLGAVMSHSDLPLHCRADRVVIKKIESFRKAENHQKHTLIAPRLWRPHTAGTKARSKGFSCWLATFIWEDSVERSEHSWCHIDCRRWTAIWGPIFILRTSSKPKPTFTYVITWPSLLNRKHFQSYQSLNLPKISALPATPFVGRTQ